MFVIYSTDNESDWHLIIYLQESTVQLESSQANNNTHK